MERTLIKKLTDIEKTIKSIKKQVKDKEISKDKILGLYQLVSKIHDLSCGKD